MSTTQPLANLADMVRERAKSRGNAVAYEFEGRITSFVEFNVKTNKQVYSAQRVVMSIGTRGKPRKLGVGGEHLTKVTSLLTDAADHRACGEPLYTGPAFSPTTCSFTV